MRTYRIIGALAVAASVVVGCQDITNPVEEFGTLAPAWVAFEAPRAVNGSHGTYVPVVYGALTTRPEEDVEIDITFGGDAVFGEDYVIVDGPNGAPRTDLSAAGGTLMLDADPSREGPQDTLWVFVPTTAEVGSVVEIEMADARTVTGAPITVGYIGQFTAFEITVVPAPAEIPEGTYSGALSGGLTGATTVQISESDGDFDYEISDIAAGAFGPEVAWEFSVLSDGTTQWSATPRDFTLAALGMTGGITGTFDFETNTLTWNVQYTDSFAWSGAATLQ
jgi:hypothetical protein